MPPRPGPRSLPADWVGVSGHLPRHCSRHGLPAVATKDFALQSRVDRAAARRQPGAGAVDMANRLARHGTQVRVVHVRGWPLCPRCLRTRRWWLAIASVLFFGGLVAFAGALLGGALTDGAPWLAAVAGGGFVLLPLSALPFSRGALGRLTGARTSPDGTSVLVDEPSEPFAAELPASY